MAKCPLLIPKSLKTVHVCRHFYVPKQMYTYTGARTCGLHYRHTHAHPPAPHAHAHTPTHTHTHMHTRPLAHMCTHAHPHSHTHGGVHT